MPDALAVLVQQLPRPQRRLYRYSNLTDEDRAKGREARNATPYEDRPISTKWRSICAMELRGYSHRDIAQQYSTSESTISNITTNPRYCKYRDKLLGEADNEFLALKPLAVAAVATGLKDADPNVALRASDQWFRVHGYGTYGAGTTDGKAATAEDVAKALIAGVQVNVTVNNN